MIAERATAPHDERPAVVLLIKRRLEVMAAQQTLGHHHPATALALARLGGAAASVGRVDEAESAYRLALAILQTQPAPDRVAITRTLVAQALVLLDSGRRRSASTALRRAAALLDGLSARDPY